MVTDHGALSINALERLLSSQNIDPVEVWDNVAKLERVPHLLKHVRLDLGVANGDVSVEAVYAGPKSLKILRYANPHERIVKFIPDDEIKELIDEISQATGITFHSHGVQDNGSVYGTLIPRQSYPIGLSRPDLKLIVYEHDYTKP